MRGRKDRASPGTTDAAVRDMREFENLVELAEASVARFAQRPLFGEERGGEWRWTSYADWQRGVDALRGGLASLGIQPGDHVAIVSRNSAAWATAAYASYGLGATFVPMYEAQRVEEWEFILRDCGAVLVFARTLAIAETLRAIQPRIPALRHVITIEGDPRDETSVAALQQLGALHPLPARPARSDDLAGLVYTSGTTGLPKGVMLSQGNLTSNVHAALAAFPISPHDRSVSFLPWAHVYGQVVELHILIAAGASTAFNTDSTRLLDDLHAVKPTMLIAVPRVFNKLHALVSAQIAHEPRLVRTIFWRGIHATIRRNRGEPLSVVDRIVAFFAGFLFAAVRNKLGGHLRFAVSASATLSLEIAEFIDALGLTLYEGYGLTETSPVVSTNRPGHRKLGSVGQVVEGVRVVIDESRGDMPGEGEIVVYGPNVMKGYYMRPEENVRAYTPEGGLRTGDLGHLDADGYLFITGRIKEQYKLENGKYVMPSPLEEQLALSPYIQNVMLHGAARPYNVALVVIDEPQVRRWAAERHVELGPDLSRDDKVRELILDELAMAGKELRPYERPVDCVVIGTPLTVDSGLLTPTLKLKRKQVLARFGAELEALYEHPHPRAA
jgi:long-chain acyl-CoA synthetase